MIDPWADISEVTTPDHPEMDKDWFIGSLKTGELKITHWKSNVGSSTYIRDQLLSILEA